MNPVEAALGVLLSATVIGLYVRDRRRGKQSILPSFRDVAHNMVAFAGWTARAALILLALALTVFAVSALFWSPSVAFFLAIPVFLMWIFIEEKD